MRHGADPRRKREKNGRYAVEQLCDACGKPIRGQFLTDEEVVGGGDGPGFYICSRKTCGKICEPMTVEERRAHYKRH